MERERGLSIFRLFQKIVSSATNASNLPDSLIHNFDNGFKCQEIILKIISI